MRQLRGNLGGSHLKKSRTSSSWLCCVPGTVTVVVIAEMYFYGVFLIFNFKTTEEKSKTTCYSFCNLYIAFIFDKIL